MTAPLTTEQVLDAISIRSARACRLGRAADRAEDWRHLEAKFRAEAAAIRRWPPALGRNRERCEMEAVLNDLVADHCRRQAETYEGISNG